MQYEILEQREQVTVKTVVKFTYADGVEQEVDIAHFQPADEAEITQGIENRYVSELRDRMLEAKAADEKLSDVAVAELLTYDTSDETAAALGVKK